MDVGHTLMQNKSGVYEILNTANGKRYIGSAKHFGRRWIKHRKLLRKGTHHSPKLQNAWNKYGAEAFVFKVILTCAPTKEMLYFYEQQLLDKVEPEYNIARDARVPMAGTKASAVTKEKMSKSQKARVRDPDTGRKISEALKGNTNSRGRVLTDDHKRKLSEANMGNPGVPGNQFGLGYKHTDEAKEAISRANCGKKESDATKLKKSEIMRGNKNGVGHKLAQEHIDKLTTSRQPYYESLRVAKATKLAAAAC